MSSNPAVIQPLAALDGEDVRNSIVERARSMIPDLIARQAETEKRTYYGPETHAAFKEAGFYRILMPKKFGGLDLDVTTYYQVVMELAAGCPSTAWEFCLGSAHAVTLCGMMDEDAQSEIFDLDEPFICAMTTRPQGEARRQPNGDWKLNGVFNFCSGVPYSSHFMGHAMGFEADGSEIGVITFVARRSEWTMLDDWGGSLGMRGSGSHSIRFEDAHIPATYVNENATITQHRLPPKGQGGPDFDNPLYYGGTLSLWLLEPTALTLGMVKGALDECTMFMKKKTVPVPPITLKAENPDFQRWYGAAATKIATAEAAYAVACEKWTEDARINMQGLLTPDMNLEITSNVICGEVMEICWDAMQLLYRVAGTTAIFDGQRWQRIYRDISTARSHGFNTRFDQMHRDLTGRLLGQPISHDAEL
jgi:3-hydroxy-9,10-secoandrosta-1,3,5(10)-triene-9,17-dione monooxygenase